MFHRIVRGALKLRYLLLGGAITGGVTMNKRYEEWKDGLPDLKWLEDIFPDNQEWKSFSRNLIAMRDNVRDSIEIGKGTGTGKKYNLISPTALLILDPRLKQLGENKMAEWRMWFDSRLDDAIEAAATQDNPQIEGWSNHLNQLDCAFVIQEWSQTDRQRERETSLMLRADILNIFHLFIIENQSKTLFFSSGSFETLSELISQVYGGNFEQQLIKFVS